MSRKSVAWIALSAAAACRSGAPDLSAAEQERCRAAGLMGGVVNPTASTGDRELDDKCRAWQADRLRRMDDAKGRDAVPFKMESGNDLPPGVRN